MGARRSLNGIPNTAGEVGDGVCNYGQQLRHSLNVVSRESDTENNRVAVM